MENHGILQAPYESTQLRQRHRRSHLTGNRQLQQATKITAHGNRGFNYDPGDIEHRIVLNVTSLKIAHRHIQSAINVGNTHPDPLRFLSIDLEPPNLIRFRHQVVDVVEVLGLLEHFT